MRGDSSGYKYIYSMIEQLKEKMIKIKEITKETKYLLREFFSCYFLVIHVLS